MSQINPFAGAIAQTPAAARLAASDRDLQLRKAAERARATGYTDQPVDEFVESADTVAAVGDDEHHEDPRRKKRRREEPRKPDDDKPHVDIKA